MKGPNQEPNSPAPDPQEGATAAHPPVDGPEHVASVTSVEESLAVSMPELSRTPERFTLLTAFHLAFLALLVVMGFVVLLCLHGVIDRHSGCVEFLTRLGGIISIVSTALVFVVTPAVTLLFSEKPAATRAIRNFVAVRLLNDEVQSLRTVFVQVLIVLLGIVCAIFLNVTPTSFDQKIDMCLENVYTGNLIDANAECNLLKQTSGLGDYDKASLDLVDIAVSTCQSFEQRDHNFDSWRVLESRNRAWFDENRRSEFDVEIIFGIIFRGEGEPEKAKINSAEALSHMEWPKQRSVGLMFIGDEQLDQNDVNSALYAYNQALLDSDTSLRSSLMERVGICRYKLRDWKGAIAATEEALSLDSRRKPVLLSNLGLMQLVGGDAETAVVTLNEAVRLSPSDAVARLNLVIAYVIKAETRNAEDQMALALDALSDQRSAGPNEDIQLARYLQAWAELRKKKPNVALVVDFVRQADGLKSDIAVSKDIASNNNECSKELENAADGIQRSQHSYGLEFIERDFLVAAESRCAGILRAEAIRERIDVLPPAPVVAPNSGRWSQWDI